MCRLSVREKAAGTDNFRTEFESEEDMRRGVAVGLEESVNKSVWEEGDKDEEEDEDGEDFFDPTNWTEVDCDTFTTSAWDKTARFEDIFER